MWTLVVFFSLLSVWLYTVNLVPQNFHSQKRQDVAQANAQGWLTYRNQVVRYSLANPSASCLTTGSCSIVLPATVTASSGWGYELNGNIVYVWGDVVPSDWGAIRDVAGITSHAIGFNESGQWVSPLYGYMGASVPGFIPNNDIVSMFRVN